MTKICEECGHSIPNDATSCPNCGCPEGQVVNEEPIKTNDFNVDNGVVDHSVLNFGRSTEAEAIVTDIANNILKWGNILAIVVPILYFIYGLITVLIAAQHECNIGAVLVAIVTIIIAGIISYFVIKFLAKLIWGIIMLFVNMSTTLKRIETPITKDGPV